MSTFGELLRQYRMATQEPERRRPLSQARLATLLAQQPRGHGYTAMTISNWEKNKHLIRQDERELLLSLIFVLHTHGGIKSLDEANTLLKNGNYRALDPVEIDRISPAWLTTSYHLAISPSSAISPFVIPPLPPQGVLGRASDLQWIVDMLALDDEAAVNVPPVALRGMGGIGKTTLAATVAHRPAVSDTFPDAILWAGLGPHPAVRSLLDGWGRALGVDLLAERDEAACQARLKAVLSRRRALLIIDDVWETSHGLFFHVGGPYCRTLLTTRELSVSNDLATRARTWRVDVLSQNAAIELLRRLAPEVVATDFDKAQQLCQQLEYLPLALTLAGRWLANEANVTRRMQYFVDELIERRERRLGLSQHGGRPGLDASETVSLQAILGMSVERLSKNDQARFAMLAVFGGEPLSWDIEAAASVWECSIEEAEATVSHFCQRGLVEARRNDRYWLHALLADYAAEMQAERGL